MRLAPRQLFAVLLLAPGLALAAQSAPAPRVLRVGVETHTAPYTFADELGRPAGFSVELLQAVTQTQGLRVEFHLLDWDELLDGFKQGRIDILCNIVATPARLEFMRFSTTTMQMQGGLLLRRDAPAVRTSADLAGRRLATLRESRAHEYARQQNWNVQYVYFANLKECATALHEGRADLLIATELATKQLLKTTGYTDIVDADMPLLDFDYRTHFGVHLNDTELLAQLNEGLITVQKNGSYAQLHEKWLGPLEPRKLRWRDVQDYLLPLLGLAVSALGILLWQRRLLYRLSQQARAIRESEERLQLVFEGSQDAFWDWDVASGKIQRSPRWAGMLGYTLDEISFNRQGFFDLVHPDDRPHVLEDEEQIWQGRDHYAIECRMRAKSGKWRWILDRGKVVVRDPTTGEPRRITGTHTDITDRKQAEEEANKLQHKMLEAQKLESLGVLAGGIAHDFNNLLTVILGNCSLAQMDASVSPANQVRFASIITSTSRAAELCHQLLAYAGKGSFMIERINLNEMITETTRLLELSISKQARLEFDLAPALLRIEADPTQIRQVIMNLVINASEAHGETPGVIRLTTKVITLPQPSLSGSGPVSELTPGDYVYLEIADTGSGMTPEVLTRIFDPFFTTKFTGRGLGLAAVLGIVRTHGGTLQVQSTPGQGSIFQIYLPVSQKQTSHPFVNTDGAQGGVS